MKARCLPSRCRRRIVGLSENERDWAAHYYGHSPLQRNVVSSQVTATALGQRLMFPKVRDRPTYDPLPPLVLRLSVTPLSVADIDLVA